MSLDWTTASLALSVTKDPSKLPLAPQHQNIWSLHPTGDLTFHWFYKRHNLPLWFVSSNTVYFQLTKLFPGLMMKLLVKTVKTPIVTFKPNNVTIQATGTVTAYAIQPNATLSPLFVLNLVCGKDAMMKNYGVVRKKKNLKLFKCHLHRRPASAPNCLLVKWGWLELSPLTSKLLHNQH